MMSYFIQVVLFQGLFVLVYELGLKKETFFNHNRVYLLGTSIVALLIPLFKFSVIDKIVSQSVIVSLPEVVLNPTKTALELNETEILGWLNSIFSIKLILYVGVVSTFVFFIYRLYQLYNTIKRNEISQDGKYAVIKLKTSSSAYSFFNFIFLGEMISEVEKKTILSHEKVHANEKHSLDLIWFELLKIVFWFSPAVYLYQYRIKEVHEFIADKKSLKIDSKSYQNVLLNQLFQSQNLSFVNPFFKKSLIKNRLIMLSKSKSNHSHLIKYFSVLPLILGMLFYSSCVGEQEQEEKTIEVVENQTEIAKPNNIALNISEVEQIAMFPECENLDSEQAKKCFATEISSVINKNFNIKLADELKLEGEVKIFTMFNINENGDVADIKVRAPHQKLVEEAERVLNLIPTLKPALKDGKPVKIKYALPIKFQIK
jgi:bla regulator protein BlaR1